MDEQYFDYKRIADKKGLRRLTTDKPKTNGKMPRWFYWVVWISFFLVLITTAVGLWQGAKIRDEVARLEEKTKIFNEVALRDSIAGWGQADIKYLVAESTQRCFDTYLSTQDNMITLLGIIISALVAIVGIAVPVIVNNSVRNSNEAWYKKKVNDVEAQMEKNLKSGLNKISRDVEKGVKKTDLQTLIVERQSYEFNNLVKLTERFLINNHLEEEYKESINELEKRKSVDEKIKYLESEINTHKQQYPASGFYKLGILYFKKKNYGQSIAYLKESVLRNPKNAEALKWLSEAYLQAKECKLSWEAIERALAIDKNIDMYEIRYRAFLEMSMYQNAIEDVKICLDSARSKTDKKKYSDILSEINKRLDQSIDNIIEIIVGGVKFNMIKVKGGAFDMGVSIEEDSTDPDELPLHRVLLDDYYIGETAVTQKLWNEVMEKEAFTEKGSDYPIFNVSWDDVQEFIDNLNMAQAKGKPKCMEFCLPTEAQWEFAARGGVGIDNQKLRFSGNNEIGKVAWYSDNCRSDSQKRNEDYYENEMGTDIRVHKVKQKEKNKLGLYDMSGNVCEWCQDAYGYYRSEPQINPIQSSGRYRVTRGGSWNNDQRVCSVSFRMRFDPEIKLGHVGFRLALVYKNNN